MNILTFHRPIQIEFFKAGKKLTEFHAGRPYVFGRPQLVKLAQHAQFNDSILKNSMLDMRIRNFVARMGQGGRVLLYNGSGGFGDQIMTWPISLILHNYGYEVHVLTDPGNHDCWSGLKWVKSILTLPIEMSIFSIFDHHAMFEVVANLDEHHPQLHPVDTMLFKLGIEPNSVDPKLKRVAPNFTAFEIEEAKKSIPRGLDRLGIYQLSCASRIRSLSIDSSCELFMRLCNDFPDVTWLALHDGISTNSHAVALSKELPINGLLYTAENIRILWALTSFAKVVVAPDSMMVHVAGSLNVPCVGLWGPTDPPSRAMYYDNHHPVFESYACPMSPCHCYTSTFPRYCPTIEGIRSACSVMEAISFETVSNYVRDAITAPATA